MLHHITSWVLWDTRRSVCLTFVCSSLWAANWCVMSCLSVKSSVASIREAPAQECHEFPVSSWGLCVVFPVSGSRAFYFFYFSSPLTSRSRQSEWSVWGTGNVSLAFSRRGARRLGEGRCGCVMVMLWRYAMLLVGVLWVLPMLALALLSSDGDGWVGTGWRLVKPHGHPDRESTGQNTGNIQFSSHLCV